MAIREVKLRNNFEIFDRKLHNLGISLNDQQKQQFAAYYEMMVEKNKVMNLTSITEPLDVIDKHFVDSLALQKIYPMNRNISVIDVGTGAGFPGIPLKIAFPEIKIVLLDSLNKRIKFLQEVVDALDLKNVVCVHGRSEDLARKEEYRETFDLCISRAVANLATLSEFCLPFVKTGGMFISYKAGNCQEEIKNSERAVEKLGGKISEITELLLPETDLERVFVQVKKEKPTPKKYPRKAGTPAKEPLQ